ncbi:RNA methyltransferase, TrmH family, group 3 [Thermaerobacter marianensis DSM 12885]|uniref:RNA methyltransferase, TrmH family, group 3 n=1 Tax=Thermaerobacter marianensis (strain ATCC 700841 / DSM 12885 / JCM 10246 / 7p75a) TaxID=644966 RepID=E6SLE8_THEM7|nr:23S rRNA (guanosine(2251)-2'-O)-methyltransferase RlmB [Thermaerobacter marianensis]ADU52390.1 RNA methyltransferase, TrmH family, group 3 [Thermaerobacter marianensis DSM 12885]
MRPRGEAQGGAAAPGGGPARRGPGAPPGGRARRAGGAGPRRPAGEAAFLQVEGRRPVLELLGSAHPVHRVLVARGRRGAAIAELEQRARARGVPVEEVDPVEIERRAQTDTHQGVLALAAPLPRYDLLDLLDRAAGAGQPPLLVICAEIQDPHNLGAVFRTAEAAGAHGAVVPVHRSAPLGATVFKSSAGALVHLPVAEVTNLARSVEQLKERGVWVVAADPEGAEPYDRWDWTQPVAVVLGSEGRGVPPLVRRRCDGRVTIPMAGRVGSLNVSVAAGVLLFEAARQRRQQGLPSPTG